MATFYINKFVCDCDFLPRLKRNETFVVSRDLARGNVSGGSHSKSLNFSIFHLEINTEDIPLFNCSEISGPIILDMYRAIADYTKTTKYEINLHAGDQVEIVEKNQNGETISASNFDP